MENKPFDDKQNKISLFYSADMWGEMDLELENEIRQEKEGFIVIKSTEIFGYYRKVKEDEKRLTNFIVNLTQQIFTTTDSKPDMYFRGSIEFEGGEEIPIERITSKDLATPQALMLYLTNLCGTRISFYGHQSQIVEAIKIFNREAELFEAKEFGYNNDLNEYVTSDLIITQNSITEKETPIKYCDYGNRNKLGFEKVHLNEVEELKAEILGRYIPWDKTYITITALTFTFLPLIYPFLKNVVNKKAYLMLKGPSGSGKSLICELLQQFYGDFQSIITWNSTSTAISVAGNSFKDSAFMVDDFKTQNFSSPRDVNKVMALLQNYADENSRSRSNISLELKDERFIKGLLIISAEDLVITEASTIARGIIVDMENKLPNFQGEESLRKLSSQFKKITPHFIQHIMRYPRADFETIFKESKTYFEQIVDQRQLNGNNLSRLINNFALLKTAWTILSKFLFLPADNSRADEFNLYYEMDLRNLFINNYELVQVQNPEIKFEQTFWDLVSCNTLKFYSYDEKEYDDSKLIGRYKIDTDGNSIKIAFNFNKAYKIVNSFLYDQGGIGNSKDALLAKLIHAGKIRKVGDRVSLSSNVKFRGIEWIGDYPREYFGLKDELEINHSYIVTEDDDDLLF